MICEIVEKIIVNRNQVFDKAILGEIQSVFSGNEILTRVELNEKAIIEALEKHTTKKIIKINNWKFCPRCHGCLDLPVKINYCCDCGQALDWSADEGGGSDA